MAKTFQDTITVKFIGDGTGLEKTIKDLDVATKLLIDTQLKLKKSEEKKTKASKMLTEANRKLYIELKSKGIPSFKHLRVETDVLTRAFKGNKTAIRKVRNAMKLATDRADKFKNTTKVLTEANRKLYRELKSKGLTSFKQLGLSSGILTRALQGNKTAIHAVRNAMAGLTVTNKKLRGGLLATVHDTRILGGSFAVLRSKMLLVSFATSLVGMSIGKLLKLQAEQEKAEKTLSLALGYRSQALLDFASAQQKVTKYGDEETITAMALVGAYTMDEEAIKKVTKASMELASGRGMDLKSAIDMVSKSIFSGTNALTRYGVEIGDATTKEEKLVAITERLTEMYGGQSEQSGTLELATIQLGNSISDVGEKFGAVLTPAVMSSMTAIKEWTNTIKQEDINNFTKNLVTLTATWYTFRLAVVMSHWEIKKFIVSVTATTFAMKTLQVAMVRTGIGALVVALGFTIQKMLELSGWFDIASKKSRELTDEIEALRKAQIALHAGQLDEATIAKFAKEEEELRKSTQKKTEAFYEEIKALKIKNELTTATTNLERIRIKMGDEWVRTHGKLVVAMLVEMGTEERLIEIKKRREERARIELAIANRIKSALDATASAQILVLESTLRLIQVQEDMNGSTIAGQEAMDNLQNSIIKLKNPVDNVVDTYKEWFAVQDKTFDKNKQMAEWVAKLTEENYALADSLGLVKKTQAELNAESAVKSTTVSKEKEVRATLELLEAEHAEFVWMDTHIEQRKAKLKLWEGERASLNEQTLGTESLEGGSGRFKELTQLIAEAEASILNLGHTEEQVFQKKALAQAIKATKEELDGLAKAQMTVAEKDASSAIANTITMKEEAIRVTLEQLELEKTLMSIQLGENVGVRPDTTDELAQYDAIIEAIQNQKDALIDLNETKKASMAESIDIGLQQFQQATGAYSSFVQGAVDSDINALKARDDYQRASAEQRAVMEEDVRRKNMVSLRRSEILKKASAVASASMNTYEAVTETYAKIPHPWKIPASLMMAGLGMAQVASIVATPLAYRQGGLVGGQSHEQGGTMIEAERGEFVMSRSAVESIGTSALNNMNQGGGGAITINISAPLVDETVIDHIIPAINKAQRMNLA